LDGSFFARGRGDATYSFGIYNNPSKLKWYNEEGYLPCLVTEFERDNCTVKIKLFGDQIIAGGNSFVVVYCRVQIINHDDVAHSLNPSPSDGALIALTSNSESVNPGQTVNHDYAVAADRFGNSYDFPGAGEIKSQGMWDERYTHMKNYWDSRLNDIVHYNQLPDQEILNGLKNGFIVINIIKDGTLLHVAEGNYDQLYNHDQIGIMASLFSLGEYKEAKSWLKNIAGPGYPDGEYKGPWVWALYLMKTDDTAFVNENFSFIQDRFFAYIKNHRSGPNGTMANSYGPDFYGFWTADNWSALLGLWCYKYICATLGRTADEAEANSEYKDLLTKVNSTMNATIRSNGLSRIPVQIDQAGAPFLEKLYNSNDSHMFMMGRWPWDGLLFNADFGEAPLNLIDSTYDWLYKRKSDAHLPPGTHGGFQGSPDMEWCTAYNVGHASIGLAGTGRYRDNAIKAYRFMIDSAMSGPYSWWEGIDRPVSVSWEGTHPEWGSGECPHGWGISFNEKLVTESIVAEKADGRILIGRGMPVSWSGSSKIVDISNFPIQSNQRMGVKIETIGPREIQFSFSGSRPSNEIILNLPIFANNIAGTTSGSINVKDNTVTLAPSVTMAIVTLAESIPGASIRGSSEAAGTSPVKFSLYGFNRVLRVSSPAQGPVRVALFNARGGAAFATTVQAGTAGMQPLPGTIRSGLYMMRIKNSDGVQQGKTVLIK
jgi:hypothetical protein